MKNILILVCLIFCFEPVVMAESYPIKITPTQVISTHFNEVEVGDWIRFKAVNDVYINNKLFLRKDTIVVGEVDYIHENGLFGDNAEIVLQKFTTKDVNDKLVIINHKLILNKKDYLTPTFGDKVVKHVGGALRGNEVLIKPGTTYYNILVVK